MRFILNNIALRSFWHIPYAYYQKDDIYAHGLTKEEFELLLKCDGKTDIEDSDLLHFLCERELIKECHNDESLIKWQEYRDCDNRYMPKMNLQITGRCNYNCLHCFNAKDNEPLQSELSFIDICKLLDDCEKCGIQAFTITGGEPMIHPQYKQIIEEIYKRNMFVFDLNTNGFYINQEMLDWMKSIRYYPLIKISFDGLGFHNWMRGYSMAEEKTLEAIKLCISNGFKVKIQMNINKKNKDSLIKSCNLLDKMGVEEIRLINTTDVPRWLENGKEYTFALEEYYDAAIDFIKDFYKEKRNTKITFWMFCEIFSKQERYSLSPIACSKEKYRDTLPLCKGARGMIAVGSNGNVYPCHQASGLFEEKGIYLGNILKESLQKLLQDSDYIKMITSTVGERREKSEKCHKCEYFKKCTGGCPVLAFIYSGDYYLEDKSKCIFFNNKYDDKLREVFKSLGFNSRN